MSIYEMVDSDISSDNSVDLLTVMWYNLSMFHCIKNFLIEKMLSTLQNYRDMHVGKLLQLFVRI